MGSLAAICCEMHNVIIFFSRFYVNWYRNIMFLSVRRLSWCQIKYLLCLDTRSALGCTI